MCYSSLSMWSELRPSKTTASNVWKTNTTCRWYFGTRRLWNPNWLWSNRWANKMLAINVVHINNNIYINVSFYCRNVITYNFRLELLAAGCKWLWSSVPGLMLLEVYSGDQQIKSFKKPGSQYSSIITKINSTRWKCDATSFVEHVEITFENKITWVW